MRLVWKLLRQHISFSQLAGFFFANLCGMVIVLLSVQFYKDVLPVFTEGDSFMKKDYVIVSKKVSTLGSFVGKSKTFSEQDIAEISEQPFTKGVGAFIPSQFKVSAGMGMENVGLHMSTAMFFESVPDEYVDVNLDKWEFDEYERVVPIIIPRNYLNLYNFGFAQSRSLPQLSEGVMGMVNLDIRITGVGRTENFKGKIVGFSNRLNTILVPETFMTWANNEFAPGQKSEPSRLIVEVNNPTDDLPVPGKMPAAAPAANPQAYAPKYYLVLESDYRNCAFCRFAYQCALFLYFDAQYLFVAAKEYIQVRESVIDRLQSG